MLRFRIFSVPFVVTGYFWLGCVLSSGLSTSLAPQVILRTAVWTACVFVSVVLHELGHALAGRRFGASPRVVLHAIGGMTYLSGARLTRGRGILVSLAGPAMGLTLYAAMRVLTAHMGGGPYDMTDPIIAAIAMALGFLTFINFVWSLFNLLPILPLDGGQIMRDALGPRQIGLVRTIGGVTAAVLAGVCVEIRQPLMILAFGYLGYLNFKGETRSLPGGVSGQGA